MQLARHTRLVEPGIERGLGTAAGNYGTDQPQRDVGILGPMADDNLFGDRRAGNLERGARHVLRHGTAHASQRLIAFAGTLGAGSGLYVRARDGAARACPFNGLQSDAQLAGQRARCRAGLTGRMLGRPWSLRGDEPAFRPRLRLGSVPTTVPASGRAAPSSTNSTTGAPTLMMSPGSPMSRAMCPEQGDGTSTTALAVSTETSG